VKRLLLIPAAIGALIFGSIGASATNFTLSPWAYSCGHTDFGTTVTRADTPDSNGCPATDTPGTAAAALASGTLTLSKTCGDASAAKCTADDMSAGATVGGLVHVTAFSFDVEGYCGAGAPRLNVVTSDNKIHFFGCAANNHNGHVTIDFSAAGDGAGNGGVKPADTIKSIDFVQDEAGTTNISNITITGTAAVTTTASPSPSPTTTTTPRLAQTGSGLPVLPLGIGTILILIGLSRMVVRRA
jgi:hypothetical protein